MRSSVCGWAVTALASIAPAVADDRCAPIAKAMLAVNEQPAAVRQRMIAGPPPNDAVLTEAILRSDAMYVREGPDGPWRKSGMDQAKRRVGAAGALKIAPLSECSAARAEIQGGVEVQVFGFRQPDLMTAGQFTTTTIWVGRDGLPRRIVVSDGSYQTFEYGDFPAPEVAPARQRRR